MCDARGYVYEHRLIVARSLGRCLDKNEVVHHRNLAEGENSICVLKLVMAIGVHTRIHSVPTRIYLRCSYCGETLVRLLWQVMVNKTGRFYCDNVCQAKHQYKYGIPTGKGGFYQMPS